ncbi:alpha/beta hydrolase [Atopobiaceae bacterium 24-176]
MQDPNSKRRWPKVLLALLAACVAVVLFAGNYLVDYALQRSDKDVAPATATAADAQAVIDGNKKALDAASAAWAQSVDVQEVSVTSDDGLVLRGSLFKAPDQSHRWAIVCHGYQGSRDDVRNIASFYGQHGFNVLTPDLRACGTSDGQYLGMGWLDRNDLLRWIGRVTELDLEAAIVCHGVSMGGATVMMCSGEQLPANVRAIVDDCGYTSAWDIFSDELSYLFGLPDFPFLTSASAIAQMRAGYNFTEASALEQVRKAQVPMLFIHGTADTFVRPEMAQRLYDVCPADKKLLMVDGAGHGDAYKLDPKGYCEAVFGFLGSHGL